MNALPAALHAHATTLLAGTGLSAEDAARIAADPAAPVPADAAAAAEAIRAGWAAAGRGDAS